jgi:TolA-binding protein
LYQEQRDFKKAMGFFRQVIKEFPKGFLAAEAQGALGECLEAQGKTREALKAYQVVLDDYPSAVWDQAKQRIDALKSRLRDEENRKKEE